MQSRIDSGAPASSWRASSRVSCTSRCACCDTATTSVSAPVGRDERGQDRTGRTSSYAPHACARGAPQAQGGAGDRRQHPAHLVLGQRPRQVGLAEHADEPVSLDDGQPAHVVVHHRAQRLAGVVVGPDGHRLLPAELRHQHLRGVLAVGHAAHDDVAVGDDAVQALVLAADGQGADPEVAHACGHRGHGLVGPRAVGVGGHQLACSGHPASSVRAAGGSGRSAVPVPARAPGHAGPAAKPPDRVVRGVLDRA